MLHSKPLPNHPVACPTCENKGFRVYRREPAGEGGIVNRCRCEMCDETFAFEEDRMGRIVTR